MRLWKGALVLAAAAAWAAGLPEGVRFLPGPVNGLLVGSELVVYGDAETRVPKASHVLFTHARRDVVWAGQRLVAAGAKAVVPQAERGLFDQPEAFWRGYETARFHDSSQVNTKVLRLPLPVAREVRGGETIEVNGVRVHVIATPGYTPGAVSYWMEIGGKRIACTGDLIYGDGQLFDLSSLQDAIPEAKTRGYHGYAARAGALIESLRAIAALQPDVLAPARGPLIADPPRAIGRLIARLQALMASHFATDALRWYWGEESLRLRSRRALEGAPVDSMPAAGHRPLPDWAIAVSNSRILMSASGHAFVVDAGYQGLQDAVDGLMAQGRVKSVEGIWITHYHDDHSDFAQSLAERWNCPVYFTARMREVLERPGAYRLPALTTNAITRGLAQQDGARLRWREFELTFFDFPGQTLYHGGLLARRQGGGALFFAGDSFTPSGLDDYCLQNRNFVNEGSGYLYCLNLLEKLDPDVWLVNQHVRQVFRFSPEQIARMRRELRTRRALLQEFAPWPAPNYAVDENWAAVHPYGSAVPAGGPVELELRIMNHAPKAEQYRVRWNLPPGWRVARAEDRVTAPARGEASARVVIAPSGKEGLHVVTADVEFGGRLLREWSEALVRVFDGGR